MDKIPLYFERNGLPYEGYFKPVDNILPIYNLNLYRKHIGILMLTSDGWQMQGGRLQHLAWFFGDYITSFSSYTGSRFIWLKR